MVGYFGEFNVFPNDDEWLPEDIKIDFTEHYRDHIFGEVERNANGDLVVLTPAPEGSNAITYNGISALTQARYPAELGYNVPTDGIGYTNGWVNIDGIPGDGNNDVDIGNKDFNDPIADILSDDDRNLWTYGPVGGEWPPNREPGIEGVIEEWTNFWGTQIGGDYIRRGHYSFARPPQVDTISRLLGAENWSLVPEDWNFFAVDAREIGDNHVSPGGDLFRQWHREMGYNYQLSNIEHFFVADKSRIIVNFDINNIGLSAFHFDWNVELAILDADNNVLQLIPVDADMRDWKSGEINKVSVSTEVNFLNSFSNELFLGLRLVQPGATDSKSEVWKLNSEFTYIQLSNDIDFISGQWNESNALAGGWNILDTLVLQ